MVKRGVKRVLASRPGWRSLGPVLRDRGVIVVTYHRLLGEERRLPGISVEAFTRQMKWLVTHCEPIAPERIVEAARCRRTRRPPALVTFDDGYRDYHDLAYPVLKALGIPAAVFLATKLVDDGGVMWTDEITWAALMTKRSAVRVPWSDGPAIARADLSERARAHLKSLPESERRDALAALLAELDAPPLPTRQMLTWDEVRRTMDITTFGGHSHTHPILSRLDAAAADEEIRTCKERIAAETGRLPTIFAYPNGRPVDYTAETKAILRRHGFTIAFCTSEGIAGPDTDWMEVKRLPSGEVDEADFAWMAAGLMR